MLAPEILISLHDKSITSLSTSPTSVEMYCLKGLGLFIAILANLANCQTDDSYSEGSGSESSDYYSDDDYDYEYSGNEQCDKPCDFYDDADCAKECHHDNFRDADPLKKMFGDKVETCCSGHQYFFMDHCEVKLNCLEIML